MEVALWCNLSYLLSRIGWDWINGSLSGAKYCGINDELLFILDQFLIIRQLPGQWRRQSLSTFRASRRLMLKSSVGTTPMKRRSVSCQG